MWTFSWRHMHIVTHPPLGRQTYRMNPRPIRTQTYTLVIVALAAIVVLLLRRDALTRQLLERTITDIIEESRG